MKKTKLLPANINMQVSEIFAPGCPLYCFTAYFSNSFSQHESHHHICPIVGSNKITTNSRIFRSTLKLLGA